MSSVLGVGSSSGGSTLTQQLIKQQVTGDAPTFKRKAAEIIYALQLERRVSKNEILTDYLNVSPFGRNNKGKILLVLRRLLKVSLAYLQRI